MIYFIEGRAKSGNPVAIEIVLSKKPDRHLAALTEMMPFDLAVVGVEEGTEERLAALQERFKADHLRAAWYRPSASLRAYLAELEPYDEKAPEMRRISLDLPLEEFTHLERMVDQMGVRTKARLLRQSLRLYEALIRYKAEGYLIQAVKGGKLVQFPDLDTIPRPGSSS